MNIHKIQDGTPATAYARSARVQCVTGTTVWKNYRACCRPRPRDQIVSGSGLDMQNYETEISRQRLQPATGEALAVLAA